MSNLTILRLIVPTELYQKLNKISRDFDSDFDDDMVALLECYVNSYQQLRLDPAAKVLLKE